MVTSELLLSNVLLLFPLFGLPFQRLISRSLGMSAAAATGTAALQESVRISIPRYFLRGQGKDEHFEFEVKVTTAVWSSLSSLFPSLML